MPRRSRRAAETVLDPAGGRPASLEEAFWGRGADRAPSSDAAASGPPTVGDLATALDPGRDRDASLLADPDRAVRVYMLGERTDAPPEERERLADWAEAQACRACRDELGRNHDPARLAHDGCRTALRAERVLRRG